jgi:hypothetical protein
MSTLSVTNLKNAASATNNLVLNPDGSVNISGGTLSPQTGFKNRIINGSMTIDQRNNGASVSSLNGYSVDRWFGDNNTNTVGLTTQRSTVVPTGFINSLAQTVTGTGASPAAGARNRFGQRIEGFNIADLGWGSANAQTITLSFWVRSSLTGTFSAGLSNNDRTRSYVFTYAISAVNTYEYKTVTIPGDTSGTWLTDNSAGININFDIGSGSNFVGTASTWSAGDFFKSSGSVSLIANSGATFFLTGVQLEKGSTATPFEFRSIGTELDLCYRYFQTYGNTTYGWQSNAGSTFRNLSLTFPVTMRTNPTVVLSGGVGGLSVSAATANAFYANVNVGNTTSDTYITNYTASAEL